MLDSSSKLIRLFGFGLGLGYGGYMKLFAMVLACFLVAPAFSPSAHAANAGAAISVAGEYLAVTESEWAMTLTLDGDGSATYVITTWEAGKRSSTSSRSLMAGQWQAEGEAVRVTLHGENAGQAVEYRFDICLSYKSIGRTECSPGLEPVASTLPRHLSQPLWNIQTFQIRGTR